MNINNIITTEKVTKFVIGFAKGSSICKWWHGLRGRGSRIIRQQYWGLSNRKRLDGGRRVKKCSKFCDVIIGRPLRVKCLHLVLNRLPIKNDFEYCQFEFWKQNWSLTFQNFLPTKKSSVVLHSIRPIRLFFSDKFPREKYLKYLRNIIW